MHPLVDVTWLRGRLAGPGLRGVDCRYVLGRPGAGRPAWLEGHVPGAAHMDLDAELAGEPGERGRHPLPGTGAFEAAARRAGIGAETEVVAYDEAGEGGAARLWWLLRHFGHEPVAVLDGGLRAWRAAGLPLEEGEPDIAPGAFEARPREGDCVDAEGAAAARLLVDARAPERYRGEAEPIDAVAGRIPGAVNVPATELAPDGRFREPGELRRLLDGAGEDTVAYCGSGVTACTVVLAAELAGLDPVRLYPGSWSEWSRAGRPVERSGRN
ncbi:MAG: sulfurtransferase [Thermoleophilaceae bacterium]|nr:sulfurtransferase [Thermoleophilaceae bacterium]